MTDSEGWARTVTLATTIIANRNTSVCALSTHHTIGLANAATATAGEALRATTNNAPASIIALARVNAQLGCIPAAVTSRMTGDTSKG
jgi:hypothetical protein